MGRAEKRAAARMERRHQKERNTINLQGKELMELRNDMFKMAYDRTSEFDTKALIICFLLAEHRLFDFGQDEIVKTLNYVNDMMDPIYKETKTIDDLAQELLDETDVEIEIKEPPKNNENIFS